MKLIDKFGRKHRYLRVSLTDKCNLNCLYCKPLNPYISNSKKSSLLNFNEIFRLITLFIIDFEFDKVRLTGGEPFVRREIETLIEKINLLKQKHKFELTITTNGTLLNGNISHLLKNGLDRINFSLDSLDPVNFQKITGYDKLNKVINAIEDYEKHSHQTTKINTVIMKNINDSEILDFIEFVKNKNRNVRFIEYMPFSGNSFTDNKFISYKEIKRIVDEKYKLIPLTSVRGGVAKDFKIDGYLGRVSFISSISDNFCDACQRLRITATGKLKNCIFSSAEQDLDLKELLRNEFSDSEIRDAIINKVQEKHLTHPELNELKILKNNNMFSIGG